MNFYTEQILKTDCKILMAVTGGGSVAISELLKYGGASNNLIAAYVPYSKEAFDEYVGIEQNASNNLKYCSAEASYQLALRSWVRGASLLTNVSLYKIIGIGATCSLAKNGPEHPERKNEMYLSFKIADTMYDHYLELEKTDRVTQEHIVGNFILKELSKLCLELDKR